MALLRRLKCCLVGHSMVELQERTFKDEVTGSRLWEKLTICCRCGSRLEP